MNMKLHNKLISVNYLQLMKRECPDCCPAIVVVFKWCGPNYQSFI